MGGQAEEEGKEGGKGFGCGCCGGGPSLQGSRHGSWGRKGRRRRKKKYKKVGRRSCRTRGTNSSVVQEAEEEVELRRRRRWLGQVEWRRKT